MGGERSTEPQEPSPLRMAGGPTNTLYPQTLKPLQGPHSLPPHTHPPLKPWREPPTEFIPTGPTLHTVQPGGQLQESWEAWKTPPFWQGGALGQEKPALPGEQDTSQLSSRGGEVSL